MSTTNTQVVLAERPTEMIEPSTTALVEADIPVLEDGQALVQVDYLSIDPTIRTWMNDAPGYLPPIQIGEVIRSGGGGTVIESRSDLYSVGDRVTGAPGWQRFCVVDEGMNRASIVPDGIDLPTALNVLGVTGITAYFGLLDVGAFKPEDVVVVSGAAGATGSMAGQIAKIMGAETVIGIAGGPEKCAALTELMGFDAAVDYKAGHVGTALRELAPKGIDLFYDNVGGEILDAVLANLAMRGRIVLCGGISSYATSERTGPVNYLNLIIRRGRMEGFIIFDYMKRYPEAIEAITGWLKEGRLHHTEHIVEGLEHAPDALNMLFTGGNTGKLLVKVS